MKISQLFLALTIPLILLSGCKNDEISPCFDESNEKITSEILSGPVTDATGKVSVFFKLRDEAGKGVANLTEEDFAFYEKGPNDACAQIISSSEAARKIIPSPREFQFHITLVLDLSGSVLNGSLEELKAAATEFIDIAISGPAQDRLSMEIWWFDGGEDLNRLVALTNDADLLKSEIANISASISNDNSTDLNNAVISAVNVTEASLNNLPSSVITGSSVVIFTDGRDRAQRKTHEEALDAIANADERITFFTIGLGSEIESTQLSQIGRNGFTLADNSNDLVNSFANIGAQVTNEAYSFYRFDYCSPVRNGISTLIIEANRSSREKGSVRFEYDTSDFDGSCSL